MRHKSVATRVLLIAGLLGLAAAGPAPTLQAQSQPRPAPVADGLEVLAALEQGVGRVAREVGPSVVAVARGARHGDGPWEPSAWQPYEYGVGLVIAEPALVLTTYHNLGDPQRNGYAVWSQGELLGPATILAADPRSDLAVLKVQTNHRITPVAWAEQPAARGHFVLALGNPLAIIRYGQPSAAWAMVANAAQRPRQADPAAIADAPQRPTIHHFGTLLELDRQPLAGSSGAPLLNLRGELVGILTSSAALAGYEAPGVYAIPVDEFFRRVVRQLQQGKEVEYGFLGAELEAPPAGTSGRDDAGVRVGRVGMPAASAGLRSGDVIVRVNEEPVATSDELFLAVSRLAPGQTVTLQVQRVGGLFRRTERLEIPVQLAKKHVSSERPAVVTQDRPNWRGLQIDYATALPDFHVLASRIDADGCVAIVGVMPNSAAARAGLRPGTLITHLDEHPVRTPQEFYEAAEQLAGGATVRTTDGRSVRIGPRD